MTDAELEARGLALFNPSLPAGFSPSNSSVLRRLSGGKRISILISSSSRGIGLTGQSFGRLVILPRAGRSDPPVS